MESESGDYASLDDASLGMGASGRRGGGGGGACSGGPGAPPSLREREGSFSSYVSSLEGSNAPPAPNCGSVVEHSPQGRYVRFNFRIEACAYKEVGGALGLWG